MCSFHRFYYSEMNNRQITEFLMRNGIESVDVVRPTDLLLTLGSLEDVCNASIEQDRAIDELQNRVTELEESLNRLRDGVRAVVNNIDQQLRTLRNRR